MLTPTCPNCQTRFLPTRKDQRFCSGRCRSHAHYLTHREQIQERAKTWALQNSDRRHATWKARYDANADVMRARTQAWREQHREEHRAYSRAFSKRNPETVRRRQLRRYGLTVADYDRILNEQHGRCAICQTETPSKRRRFFDIDHCHRSTHVRGLLCEMCNRVIGLFRDDANRFASAARYLRRNSHGVHHAQRRPQSRD